MKRTGCLLAAAALSFCVQSVLADWSAGKRLTWTAGQSDYPSIAADSSGGLHVAWQDNTPGNCEIYYKKSTDGGASWTTSERLTINSGDSYSPTLAVGTSDNLHLVWCEDTAGDYEIYYSISTDGGESWSASTRLTWTSGWSLDPVIAVDPSGDPHVVWYEDKSGNYEICYKNSPDGGATWSATKRLTWTSGDSYSPHPAVEASGDVHVVWDDDTPGNYAIYHKMSTDGGTSWSSSRRLNWTSGESELASIGVDSAGHLHVIWDDSTPGNREVYHKKSTDGGTTWTASRRLTWTSDYSRSTALAFGAGSELHVAWHDATPGNQEIYYKKSTDGGASWTTSRRLTYTSGFSSEPAFAVDPSNTVHLVWQDQEPGNFEIYYKNGN